MVTMEGTILFLIMDVSKGYTMLPGIESSLIMLTVLFVAPVKVNIDVLTSYIDILPFFSSLEWSQWSSCELSSCKRTRTRTCSGGNECAGSRISQEQCLDSHCNPILN